MIDSDIEVSEIVKVGEKKHTNGQHAGKAKTGGTEKGKGKGKEEGEGRGKETGGEDVEMVRSKFITPALPCVYPQSILTGTLMAVGHQIWSKYFSCSFMAICTMLTLGSNSLFYWDLSNNSKRPKYEGSVVSQWAHAIPDNAKPSSQASTTSKHLSANCSVVPSMTNWSTITATSICTSQTQKHP